MEHHPCENCYPESPKIEPCPNVYLYFGGVDEDAYVYLNGKEVFEHSCKSTGLTPNIIWARAFAFDAKAHLKFGKQNTLTVRVHQSGPGSSDLIFDLGVRVKEVPPAGIR